MKYFIDQEFIEGVRNTCISFPFKWRQEHFINLISIGIVAEDGRSYYAISNEYNYWDVSDWVKDNVIMKMFYQTVHGDNRNREEPEIFHKKYGKSNKQIANEIIEFIYGPSDNMSGLSPLEEAQRYEINDKSKNPEFYGYYADYDWVLFCSLFGKMVDLPKGFPMYCKDLKQILDENIEALTPHYFLENFQNGNWLSLEEKLKIIKEYHPLYPKQKNEHHALENAKWNLELYKFLKDFKHD